MKTNKLLVVSIFTLAIFVIVAVVFTSYKVGSQSITKAQKETERKDLPIVDLPTNLQNKENINSLRSKRNERFDLKDKSFNPDKLVFKESDPEEIYDLPLSHPEKSALPVYQSDVIVIGTITDRQAHLSNDKTRVYSEFTVKIEQILKGETNPLIVNQNSISVERFGGAVRLPSGKILRRGDISERMPLNDRKYLFFLQSHNESESFSIITGYELRDGLVFPLDGVNPPEDGRKLPQFAKYEKTEQEKFLNLITNVLIEGGKNE